MFCIKDLYLMKKKIITTVSDAFYGFGNSECRIDALHTKFNINFFKT